MHFVPPSSITDTASSLPRFFQIVEESRLLKRVDQLLADARKSPFGWKIVTDYYWLEVEIAHMGEVFSEPVEVLPDTFDLRSVAALNFVALTTNAHSRMSNTGRRAVEGRLRDCVNSGFHSFYHEMETARQLLQEGFDIDFADLEGRAACDFVFRRDSLEGEIECKSLSADAGRKVHRQDFYRFVETLYSELEASAARADCRAVIITMSKRFPSSRSAQEPIRRAAKEFLEDAGKNLYDGAGFSVEGVFDGQRLREIAALGSADQYAKCREIFGESCHVAGALHDNGGCLLVVRSRQEDDSSKPTLAAIKEAIRQMSGARPSYVAIQYNDIGAADLANLHLRRRAALLSNYAFHTQASGHVAGVSFTAYAGLHEHDDTVTMPRIIFQNPKYEYVANGLPFRSATVPYSVFAELLGLEPKSEDMAD